MNATSYRPATRIEHEKFCTTEKWKLLATNHHTTFTLDLADGRILRTRVSHPVNRTSYAQSMFAHILRNQLDCTKEDFFECVDNKVLPPRPSAPNAQKQGLKLSLVYQLKRELKLSDPEIAGLTESEAKQMLADYYSS